MSLELNVGDFDFTWKDLKATLKGILNAEKIPVKDWQNSFYNVQT
jgi:hypothetical protein